MAHASVAACVSYLPAKPGVGHAWKICVPSLPSLHRPPSSGTLRERGTGFLRTRNPLDIATCDAAPNELHRHVQPVSASQTSSTTSTRTRMFPVRPRGLRLLRSGGLWGPPCGRGRGRSQRPSPLQRTVFAPHSRLTIAAGMLSPTRPIRPTSDIRVAPLEPVFDGPWFTPSRGSSRTRAAKVSFTDTV